MRDKFREATVFDENWKMLVRLYCEEPQERMDFVCFYLAMLRRGADFLATVRESLHVCLPLLRWFTAVASRVRRWITCEEIQEKIVARVCACMMCS